jgi:hypothetical protein
VVPERRRAGPGLEKNSFASVDYSVAKAVAITVLVLLVRVWPMVGLLVTSGAAWWLNAGTVAVFWGRC